MSETSRPLIQTQIIILTPEYLEEIIERVADKASEKLLPF